MSDAITLTIQLSKSEARDLADWLKETTWTDYRRIARNDDQANRWVRASDRIREPLAEALAEAQAEVFREMLDSTLVTKDNLAHSEAAITSDLDETRRELKADIDETRRELKADINNLDLKIDAVRRELSSDIDNLDTKIDAVDAGLRGEIHAMGKDLTIRLGGMIVAAVGVLAAIRYFG